METAHFKTFTEFKNVVAELQGDEKRSRLMGMLFMRQGQALADKEIVPSLEYFSARSGEDIHFVLGGWSYEDGVYKFSPIAFAQAVKAIEDSSTWRYSGGPELILFTARSDESETRGSGDQTVKTTTRSSTADLSSILRFQLQSLQGNKMFGSLDQFFEVVFRFARTYSGDLPVNDFAAQELRVGAAKGIGEAFMSFIPKDLRGVADYLTEVKVTNISHEHKPMIEIVSSRVETSLEY